MDQGTVELAGEYRGLTEPFTTPIEVRVPGPAERFGIVSDVDDTILESNVQKVGRMIRQTLHRLRTDPDPLPGRAELYRDLATEANPIFYVSSSPWNLHAFLLAFLRHRGFPLGPVLLRDLLGTSAAASRSTRGSGRSSSSTRDLPFVLIGDSGEKDPEIYADIVREPPRADPRRLHPRGAPRPGGRSRREGLERLVPGRAVRARRRQRRRTPARDRAAAALDLAQVPASLADRFD